MWIFGGFIGLLKNKTMRTATIFVTLFIFSFVMFGLGWENLELPTFTVIFISIGVTIGILLAFAQDINELTK